MHIIPSYRAAMWMGVVGGIFITYFLMTCVWSMAPLEAAVAEDDFQSKVQRVVNSPDGQWTAYLILDRAMDSTHDYELYVQRSQNPVTRRMIGESSTSGPAGFVDLRWSADSGKISAFVGPKEISAIVSGVKN